MIMSQYWDVDLDIGGRLDNVYTCYNNLFHGKNMQIDWHTMSRAFKETQKLHNLRSQRRHTPNLKLLKLNLQEGFVKVQCLKAHCEVQYISMMWAHYRAGELILSQTHQHHCVWRLCWDRQGEPDLRGSEWWYTQNSSSLNRTPASSSRKRKPQAGDSMKLHQLIARPTCTCRINWGSNSTLLYIKGQQI